MDRNIEDQKLGSWVDERMAALNQDPNWSPNGNIAYERLRENDQTTTASVGGRAWMAVAVVAVICLVFAALPWRQLKNVMWATETRSEKVVQPLEAGPTTPLQQEPAIEVPAVSPIAATSPRAVPPRTVIPAPATSESPAQSTTDPSPNPPPQRVGGPGGATAPHCITSEPAYTDEARAAKIQGSVKLEIVIHKDGTITVTKILESLGYGLDENAKAVLDKWKCEPGKVNGQAVDVQLQVLINFRLN